MSFHWFVNHHVTLYAPIKTLKSNIKNVATSRILSMEVQYLLSCHPMGMEIEPGFEDLGLSLKMAFTANQNHSRDSRLPRST